MSVLKLIGKDSKVGVSIFESERYRKQKIGTEDKAMNCKAAVRTS